MPTVTHRNAASVIQALAQDTSRVIVTNHAKERMALRGVTSRQVYRCVQVGTEVNYEFDTEHGSHKVTFEIRSAEMRVSAVTALWEHPEKGRIVVVTVMTAPL